MTTAATTASRNRGYISSVCAHIRLCNCFNGFLLTSIAVAIRYSPFSAPSFSPLALAVQCSVRSLRQALNPIQNKEKQTTRS